MTVDEPYGLLLHPQDSLLEALRVLEHSGKEIALVCAPDRRLLGTVTDGDVRRALLAGHSLHETAVERVMSTAFTAVAPSASRVEVLDIMRAREISQVPVLDQDGRLVGLHTLHELVGAVERPNWAVVMAGGKGTRLRPYTESLPKPLVRVAGRPILERIVLHLVGYGIRRIFLSVNYLAHMVEEHFGDGSGFGCSIEYLRENEPLGTAGCLSLLPERAEHPVLVMNGDLVTEANLDGMLRFHAEGGFAATMGVRQYNLSIPFGVADVQGDQLVELREKPTECLLVNAGLYVLGCEMLQRVPDSSFYLMTDLFRGGIEDGLPIGAHLVEDDWADIGRPEELMRANGHL